MTAEPQTTETIRPSSMEVDIASSVSVRPPAAFSYAHQCHGRNLRSCL